MNFRWKSLNKIRQRLYCTFHSSSVQRRIREKCAPRQMLFLESRLLFARLLIIHHIVAGGKIQNYIIYHLRVKNNINQMSRSTMFTIINVYYFIYIHIFWNCYQSIAYVLNPLPRSTAGKNNEIACVYDKHVPCRVGVVV